MPQHRPSLSSSLGPERPQDREVLKGKDVPGEGDALSRRSDRGVQGPTADLQHLQCVLEDGCWQETLFQGNANEHQFEEVVKCGGGMLDLKAPG